MSNVAELTDAHIVQEMARRLQAGQSPAIIADAVGMPLRTVQRRCHDIAAALGLPSEAERHAEFLNAVAELSASGMTDIAIAEKLGWPYRQVVSARVATLGRKFSILRLTSEERDRVDHMLLSGFSPAEIASEVGCSASLAARRAQQIDMSKAVNNRPPCNCGKPAGHSERCFAVISRDTIRQRLIAGDTCTDIARAHGMGGQWFKRQYAQPVIDDLTAEGLRCGCGEPFGHKNMCRFTGRRLKATFSDDQRRLGRTLIAAGATATSLKNTLKINAHRAGVLTRELRTELAAIGCQCPCGQLIDHPWACPARRAETKGRPRFRFSDRVVSAVPKNRRLLISRLARTGVSRSEAVRRTGEKTWLVRLIFDELRDAGLLPTKCVQCGGQAGHGGTCAPRSCSSSCGKVEGHRGACQSGEGDIRQIRTRLPDEIVAEIKRRYRGGSSNANIAVATGVARSTIARLIRGWRAQSGYPHKTCGCGRPARHPGGCAINSRRAVSKLERSRIETGIRAGLAPHKIAVALGLSTEAVLVHSRELREELFATGISCACGRLIGHPQWCSAKWDSFGLRRGRRSLPPEKEAAAITALLRGDRASDIAADAGVGITSIWRLRASLSEAARAARSRAIRNRVDGDGDVESGRLMNVVQSAVSSQLDASLRDDVVAELYLALLDGRLEVEQVRAAARSFVAQSINEWQNGFAFRSLDEREGPDGVQPLINVLSDTTASHAADEFQIGGAPP